MTKETTEFVIYMINEIANAYNKAPSEIYKVLEYTGCIDNYLVPFYDILHTMSSDSIINDIKEYVESRGGQL